MSYAETILPEFDEEMANTRKVLERVPNDRFDWKAHSTLNTIGWNANHIAEIPGWVAGIMAADSWDCAPVGGEPYKTPTFKSREEILSFFDENTASARKVIQEVREETLGVMWSLLEAGKPLVTMPRAAVIRAFIFSHLIHHRAHLLVYLRLNDIPVPGMYGPSSDK